MTKDQDPDLEALADETLLVLKAYVAKRREQREILLGERIAALENVVRLLARAVLHEHKRHGWGAFPDDGPEIQRLEAWDWEDE